MPSHIIKRDAVGGVPVERADAVLARPVRLSRDRVNLRAAPSEEAAPPRRPRVLRGEAARRAVQPRLVEVADWSPPAPSAPEPALRPAPEPEATAEPEPAPDVEVLRATWEAEWAARRDEAVAEARAEGRAEGRAEAEAELAGAFETRLEEAVRATERLERAWTDHIEASTPLLTDLAVEVAEMLLDAPLPPSIKSASARAIAEAVEELAGEASIVVVLHPVDYQRLQESGIVEQLESVHAALRWDPDPDVAEGDWTVEAPTAVIRRVREELVAALRHRLGLLTLGRRRED